MPFAAAIAGKTNRHNAIPAGQELTKIAIEVAISLPANQSVTILDMTTLSTTPPMPPALACNLPVPCRRERHDEPAGDHQAKAEKNNPLVTEATSDFSPRQREHETGCQIKTNKQPDVA